jgi:serine/threonine protein kinase
LKEDESKLDLINKKINGIKIVKYIASGGFGNVYQGERKEENIAVKIPIKDNPKAENNIISEYNIYKDINKHDNPNKFYIKLHENKQLGQKFISMKLFGESIEKKLHNNIYFSSKEIAQLGIQMINIIRYIHKSGYIHRDLKPDNFVFDLDDPNKIYCIDFGLAKKWIDENDNHIEFKSINKFCGTVRFASVNSLKGLEQSRRDDLESIGYILIYLFKKKLPWQNVKTKDKKKRHKLISKIKQNINIDELCQDLPKEIVTYFNYVRNLDFEEKPLYTSLRRLLEKIQ